MGGEAERARRLHRWWLAGVFAVALGLRLAHILAVSDFEREHLVRGMDRWLDVTVARAVAHGDVLGGRYARYESAPAYALLLGAAYRTCGRCWRGPLLLQAVGGAVGRVRCGAWRARCGVRCRRGDLAPGRRARQRRRRPDRGRGLDRGHRA